MPDVPQQPTPGQQEGAPNNAVSEALGRQIGPLKAWQWGLLVGGAYLLYRYVTTGSLFSTDSSSSGSTAAFVPVSTGEGSGGATDTPVVDDPAPTTKSVIQKWVSLNGKTPIRDKTGKVIRYITKASYQVGTRIKVNGMWLYPLLDRPGWYVASQTTTTFFDKTVVVPASTGLTTQIAAPATTSTSNPTPTASTASTATLSAIDHVTQIATPTITAYPSTKLAK